MPCWHFKMGDIQDSNHNSLLKLLSFKNLTLGLLEWLRCPASIRPWVQTPLQPKKKKILILILDHSDLPLVKMFVHIWLNIFVSLILQGHQLFHFINPLFIEFNASFNFLMNYTFYSSLIFLCLIIFLIFHLILNSNCYLYLKN
jgi:hypothetical protein